MYTAVEQALLVSEWGPECRSCKRVSTQGHGPGCAHDLALAERNFATQQDRDRARDLIDRASSPTLLPPPSST